MKVITEDSVTLFRDMRPVHVGKDHPRFKEIYQLALEDKIEEALGLVDIKLAVKKAIQGTELEIVDDNIFYGEYVIEGLLADRLRLFLEKKISINPLYNFIVRLYKNPSYRAVQELFGFLEVSALPITDDGYFMAYKKVTHQYKDKYSRTIDNSVGAKVSMPRNMVNENKEQTCSHGLHFAAYSYANTFGDGPLMAIKIDPADVVSIPSDYNNEKGRCCAYEVVEEVKEATLETSPVYSPQEAFNPDTDEKDEYDGGEFPLTYDGPEDSDDVRYPQPPVPAGKSEEDPSYQDQDDGHEDGPGDDDLPYMHEDDINNIT